jgi:phage terminase Nu1 subunit (DNA packaging protein)
LSLFANQRDTAKIFNVTVKSLQGWPIKPRKREGREVLYYLPDVIAYRVARADATREKLSLEQERALLAKAQTEKINLELAKVKGEIVDVDLIYLCLSRVLIDMRTRLLGIPTKAAPLLIGCKSIHLMKDEIEKHVHEALEQLANTEVEPLIDQIFADYYERQQKPPKQQR